MKAKYLERAAAALKSRKDSRYEIQSSKENESP